MDRNFIVSVAGVVFAGIAAVASVWATILIRAQQKRSQPSMDVRLSAVPGQAGWYEAVLNVRNVEPIALRVNHIALVGDGKKAGLLPEILALQDDGAGNRVVGDTLPRELLARGFASKDVVEPAGTIDHHGRDRSDGRLVFYLHAPGSSLASRISISVSWSWMDRIRKKIATLVQITVIESATTAHD